MRITKLMQENVAATLARACGWVNDFCRRNKLKSRTSIGLYDALLTYCPDEAERFVIAEAHQVFMCDINVWKFHDRWMNYPIDTDLCYRWSWKAAEDEKKHLYDKTANVLSEERTQELMHELHRIKNTFFELQPEILPRLNVV